MGNKTCLRVLRCMLVTTGACTRHHADVTAAAVTLVVQLPNSHIRSSGAVNPAKQTLVVPTNMSGVPREEEIQQQDQDSNVYCMTIFTFTR
jgi:hypothetical protein